MRIGVYPGSFDPATLGHLDIIRRASKLFDKLIVAAMVNGSKTSTFTMEEKVDFLKRMTRDLPNVEVECFSGLLADYVREKHACAIVKGLRAVSDFEYELQIAQTNHKISPSIDTIFLSTSAEYAFLSSSIVKEMAMYGGDISKFVPKNVIKPIYEKYNIQRNKEGENHEQN